MNRRRLIVLIVFICAFAVAAEAVLLTNAFKKNKNKEGGKPTETVSKPTDVAKEPTGTPEATVTPEPDGFVTVYREKDRTENGIRIVEFEYDGHGNMIEAYRYGEDGRILMHQAFEYDEQDRLVRTFKTDTDSVELRVSEERTYTESGKIKSIHSFSEDEMEYLTEFEYDENDVLILETYANGDPQYVSYRIKHIYDEAGREKVLQWLSAGGAETDRIVREFDSEGRIISESSYNSEGALSGHSAYSYDAAGNKLEEYSYDRNGDLLLAYKNTYDAAGNRTERKVILSVETLASDPGYNYIFRYTYDEKGRMISSSESIPGASDETEYVTHEYDENGCVVKDITRQNGEITNEIVYTYVRFEVPYENLSEDEKAWYEREHR